MVLVEILYENRNELKSTMKIFVRTTQECSYLLKISSVNMGKSPVSCGFGHIYWKNGKLIFCSDDNDCIICLEILTHFSPVLHFIWKPDIYFADWFLYEMQH